MRSPFRLMQRWGMANQQLLTYNIIVSNTFVSTNLSLTVATVFLFFSAFSRQLPLIHPASWHQSGKPQILLQAMQACGALFANTRDALDFISATLYSTRQAFAYAVVRLLIVSITTGMISCLDQTTNSMDLTEQTHVVLAIILLQSLGLFHPRKHDAPVKPTVYHTTLITVRILPSSHR